MATVSVITLAALTAYIVLGLLALARVPDAGGPVRRLIQLVLWPAVVVRAAASPSRRHARQVPPEVTAPMVAQPVAAHSVAAHAAAAAAPATTPAPPPPDAVPQSPPRDLRGDWERFVLRLTEPSE